MNEELLKILEILKEDFEMLQDGRWDYELFRWFRSSEHH